MRASNGGAVDFSVILPCFDAAATLRECLESLRHAGGGRTEVLVVDDGSTDASRTMAASFPYVRVIANERNLGPAASRNRGAAEARGAVLVFMDTDVVVPAGILDRVARHLREQPDLSALNAAYRREYTRPSLFGRFFNILMHLEMEQHPFTISTSFCAVRREAFTACGGFDEAIGRPYSDDIAFGWKFLDHGFRSGGFPDVQVDHLKEITPAGWIRHSVYHGAYWMRSFLASFPSSARMANRPVNSSFRARNVSLFAAAAVGLAAGLPPAPVVAVTTGLFLLSVRRVLDDIRRHEGLGFAAFAAGALAVEAACYLAGTALYFVKRPRAKVERARAAAARPRSEAGGLREAVEYLADGYRKRITGEGPLFVTWFVTSVCNAKCPHCFYWRNLNSHREDLTLDEVRKISATMGTFRNLLLSGGEPFLRKDLDEFCKIVCNTNGVRLLTIPTNAIPVQSVLRQAEHIARDCPDTRIFIQISVDGLPETHDAWRKVPGAFARLEESYHGIREIQKRYPNIQPTFLYAFMRQNQDEAIPTFRYLRDRLGADNINTNLVRGDSMDPTCKLFDVEKYRDAVQYLLDLVRPDDTSTFFERAYWGRHSSDYRHIYQTIKTGRYLLPCQAGWLNCVIDERGKVYPCEILGHPLGDLREAGYDFQKVWRSGQAEALRCRIRDTKCFCTHETNASINTTFNPGALVRTALAGGGDWGPRDGGLPAPQRGEEVGQELGGQTPWWRETAPAAVDL